MLNKLLASALESMPIIGNSKHTIATNTCERTQELPEIQVKKIQTASGQVEFSPIHHKTKRSLPVLKCSVVL